MVTAAEKALKLAEKIEKLKREKQKLESTAKAQARKQDTRDKIELGGLLRIAFEVEDHRPEDISTLLGGLMYVVRSIKNNNPEILDNWKAAGAAELLKRSAAKKSAENTTE